MIISQVDINILPGNIVARQYIATAHQMLHYLRSEEHSGPKLNTNTQRIFEILPKKLQGNVFLSENWQ